jgi:hypothetical protein
LLIGFKRLLKVVRGNVCEKKNKHIMLNLDLRLSELTARQFLELIGTRPAAEGKQTKKFVYGIAGLASIANCSLPTAQKIKNSGKVPFFQAGRKIVWDVEAVLQALATKNV